MKNIFVFVFILALVLAGKAEACSPAPGYPYSAEEVYDKSDVVFVGKVHSIMQDKSVYGTYRIQFEVSKVYKGDFDHAVVVTANGSSAACGYDDAYTKFAVGSVWAIYANGDLHTSSLSQNTQYKTVLEAETALDKLQGPTVCTMEYRPVCGRRNTGIVCITTPCPSTEDKTYGNACTMKADRAEFLYEGECREDDSVSVSNPNPTAPVLGVPGPSGVTATATLDATTSHDIFKDGDQGIKSWWQSISDAFRKIFFFWK